MPWILTLWLIVAAPLAADETAPTLPWTTNFESATQQAQQQQKPLFLYFTGSDWCGWCKKMDKEVLSTPDFINLVRDKFVFVRIDFPIYKTLDPQLVKQNEQLKAKYDIRGFPTIIILNSALQPIATLNYRPGGGKAYAEYLLQLLDTQQQFQKGLTSLQEQDLYALQQLYSEAQRLGLHTQAQAIVQIGVDRGSLYFLKEYYHNLLNEGKMHDLHTQQVRRLLLSKDPANLQHIPYDVAVMDFEANAAQLPNLITPDVAIKPLVDYLNRYGASDPEVRWRVEMTISQVYRGMNLPDTALVYARSALEHAPDTVRPDIAVAVVSLEQELATHGSIELGKIEVINNADLSAE